MRIIDVDGIWVQSVALFPLVDPTTQFRFEPGELLQIKQTDWMKMQPTITVTESPVPVVKKAEVPVSTAKAKGQ